MNVTGIDCGTNSIYLPIAETAPDGSLCDLVRRMRMVRLGRGVGRTGEFAQKALERAFAAAEEYGETCRAHGVTSTRFVATSAACDTRNRLAFAKGVRLRLGVSPQVFSGEEEAWVGFAGAVSGMPPGAENPLLTVDLDGDSAEIALGTMTGELPGTYSVDVGYMRMHERHLGMDVPDSQAVEATRRDINLALDTAEEHVDLGIAKGLIDLASSVTTVTVKALELRSYDSERIHRTVLSADKTLTTCKWFLSSTGAGRGALGFMRPGRVDVIPAGVLIWGEVVARAATRIHETGGEPAGIMTSEHDILDGLAMWAARGPQPPNWWGSEPSPSRG